MFNYNGSSPNHKFRVLIAGGGVAGLEAILALRALAEDRVEIDLLTSTNEFVYRPLAVAEPFGLGRAFRFDLDRICRQKGICHRVNSLESVDGANKRVRSADGTSYGYDALLLATGAQPSDAIEGAFTFSRHADLKGMKQMLDEMAEGSVRRAIFALAAGASWSLPLYELALLTADYLERNRVEGVTIMVVTPEDSPLRIFGRQVSQSVGEQLENRNIELLVGEYPVCFDHGVLKLTPDKEVAADRVVALPRLKAPDLPGIPSDSQGFIPTDCHSRVLGLDDVFAAGDVTNFPVKQGGIAAQQADAAAEMISAEAGALVTPTPFKPVLRGILLTGHMPSYLRAEASGGHGEVSEAQSEPLWWPPAKIVGKYLAPFLALRPDTNKDLDFKVTRCEKQSPTKENKK